MQLSDDCFAFGGPLLTAAEALALLKTRIAVVAGTERVPAREALGRILAADVVAARDVPPHDNSAVDGYAVYFDDLSPGAETRLALAGRAAAGHPLPHPAPRGGAVRIFTGAPMPMGENGGPDTVLMQEDGREDGGHVVIPPGLKRGANRRKAGEDVRAGTAILQRGARLRPQDLGLAASVGLTTLDVHVPLRVAIFSTGDELREPGQSADAGAVYDANRFTLAGLLRDLGMAVTDLGILSDSESAIREALRRAASAHDAIVTSGGMSTGEEDHVRAAVDALGSFHFWRLAVKPGRPVGLGQVGRVPFIGLPGNPVAMMVTFIRLARPLLLGLAGAASVEPQLYRVRAGFAHRKKAGRREWLRVRLGPGADGVPVARKFGRDGAGILSSLVESDGLVELAEAVEDLGEGAMVDYLPFNEAAR
jgi:molybdopterin molybdotransferase